METKRQEKISRLIQKEMGQLFQNQLSGLGEGGMITVTKAKITPDLGLAKIYLSLLAVDDATAVIDNINRNEREIRYAFGKEVRHQLRSIPHLKFYLDDSMDYYENIDRLLKE
ncbi:MAG: ribosome-binding factor A [Bacteroidetes bacterium 4572_77]|nr:MAG: ribosome-binding factor A [Bacteroidetes bacterium 4572_77]